MYDQAFYFQKLAFSLQQCGRISKWSLVLVTCSTAWCCPTSHCSVRRIVHSAIWPSSLHVSPSFTAARWTSTSQNCLICTRLWFTS